MTPLKPFGEYRQKHSKIYHIHEDTNPCSSRRIFKVMSIIDHQLSIDTLPGEICDNRGMAETIILKYYNFIVM